MNYTSFYNFKKPSPTDKVDISSIGDSFDMIDLNLHAQEVNNNTMLANEEARVTAEAIRVAGYAGIEVTSPNLEISTARGTEVDLNTRLGKSDTAISLKADKTTTNSIQTTLDSVNSSAIRQEDFLGETITITEDIAPLVQAEFDSIHTQLTGVSTQVGITVLSTTAQNITSAINEINAKPSVPEFDSITDAQLISTGIKAIVASNTSGLALKASQTSLDTTNTNIGTIGSLTTTNKTSLVNAVNENVSSLANLSMQQMFPNLYPINLDGLTFGNCYLTNIPVILGTVTLA